MQISYRAVGFAAYLGAQFVVGIPATAQVADEPGKDLIPTATLLSEYDCAITTSAQSRRIGQVIEGVYNEWVEIYVSSDGAKKIKCITKISPDRGQLEI